jgi:hypothetical protein
MSGRTDSIELKEHVKRSASFYLLETGTRRMREARKYPEGNVVLVGVVLEVVGNERMRRYEKLATEDHPRALYKDNRSFVGKRLRPENCALHLGTLSFLSFMCK